MDDVRMIRPAKLEDLPLLRPLWASYQIFYKVKDIDRSKNEEFISRIILDASAGSIHVYEKDSDLLGFYTLYFTYASTVSDRVAVLNDLFVLDEYRGRGFGKELLDHALSFTKEHNIPYLRWLTQTSNTNAQQLYQKYCNPTDWYMYVIKTNEI